MEALYHAISSTPIIDHHAHNLLLPSELEARNLLSITTEAGGGALRDTYSSLSHIRAVRQLSEILGCEESWESVQEAIGEKRQEPGDAWARRCFEGIEMVLMDDGLDGATVHPWNWHGRLTSSGCKRIVRIEKVAESILMAQLREEPDFSDEDDEYVNGLFWAWKKSFTEAIRAALVDPNVVGFKSVICYRTGLVISEPNDNIESLIAAMKEIVSFPVVRLEDATLSPYFVHLTAQLISQSTQPKPFQFHTGLGDNDITLSSASPSHLQPFMKRYPKVPIVLLHAGYPFTKEAGYLASVYENVFLDIGEVFPMVSQDGQENVIKESLELCPSQKLTWSTDGHWFPETYLLAVLQVREAMKQVLKGMVLRNALSIAQATRVVQDIFFNTSNHLYNLDLSLKPISPLRSPGRPGDEMKIANLSVFADFLRQNPDVKFLRMQWLDYTATLRVRILPINQAVSLFSKQTSIGITKAVLGLLHNDMMVPDFPTGPIGEYELVPCFEGLRLGERDGYATVQGEFRQKSGIEVAICPRTTLRRVVELAAKHNVSFLLGFELEVVFMTSKIVNGTYIYGDAPISRGHSWSNASALRNPSIMDVIEEILAALEKSNIVVQQVHPESAPGQYEFVTGPLPPLESVDALIASRDIIYTIAERHSLKATFVPKPYPMACGTGAHVHMSVSPQGVHRSFYAGILKRLYHIAAFTYSNASSYARVQDSTWSGGRYIGWGTQNRETPLRKVEGSHWELKCMDGLANMYLAMAAILGAGLQGIIMKEPLTWADCQRDPANMDAAERISMGTEKKLPASFVDAIRSLREDEGLGHLLGQELVDVYAQAKLAEHQMLQQMEAGERQRFLIDRY